MHTFWYRRGLLGLDQLPLGRRRWGSGLIVMLLAEAEDAGDEEEDDDEEEEESLGGE